MILSFFRPATRSHHRRTHSRPAVSAVINELEPRVVMSATVAALPQAAGEVSIPIDITGVALQAGQLVAQGTVGGQAFTAPLTLTTSPPAEGGTCPILNLELGALNLDLLGLNVATSDICLRINAESGQGQLLGNLLCSVSHLLDDGGGVGDVLGGLSPTDLGTVTSGITGILNGAFDRITSVSALSGASCDVLNLSVGPLDLNLLGLDVELDNCDAGPVTVDITAEPGSGKLLGNLLCGLGSVLDGNGQGNSNAIDKLFARIGRQIGRLA